jgi:glycosyltransferase involved in cell wall biosynthesis
MKILFVLHDYLPEHAGGSELHTHQLAKAMIARGHDVRVLFTERNLECPEGDVTEGEYDGVPTVEVIHQREYPCLAETWNQTFFAEVFRSELARLAPDIVHFHHTAFWGAACLEIAKESGARVLMTMHDFHLICHNAVLLDGDRLCDGGGPEGGCGACLPADMAPDGTTELAAGARARRHLHRRAFRAIDHVISPSHFLLTRFDAVDMAVPEDKRSVVLYGYPGERKPLRSRAAADPLRVVYLGGVYHAKGVHVLVDAMRTLGGRDRADKPAIELVIHGHLDWFPDYSAGLREMATGLPVTFAGPFPSGSAGEVLGSADVLVVPSIWYENRPITISEAFINGVVPVTTDLGGMAESVRHEVDGLVFPRGAGPALADALERLADEPELWNRLAAARPDLPDVPEVAAEVEALYGRARESAH